MMMSALEVLSMRARPASAWSPAPIIQRCGGRSCPPGTCAHDDGATERDRHIPAAVAVSDPGDRSEVEADRVAGDVMRTPDGDPHRAAVMGAARGMDAGAARAAVVPSGHGMALPSSLRQFYETRFGHDFSQVRIHADDAAAASARSLGALAYTHGSDIAFGAQRYEPATEAGRRLLAHELTHVVQQGYGQRRRIQRQLFPPVPIVVAPPAPTGPVEISAVDARTETSIPWYNPARYTGPLANFFRGDVTMTDIATMVTNVLAHLAGRTMSRLNIMDHGNSSGAEIGSDWLASAAAVTPHAATLGRLRSSFASGAFVHMQNCETGQNQGLICALSGAFGVPVYAGTGAHNPIYGFNFGDYVRCEPGGAFDPNVPRPQAPARPPAPSFGAPTPEMA